MQALTVLGQISIVFMGGNAFGTELLTGAQRGWSVMLGILVIPVGSALRCIPDAWVASASRALEAPAWPLLVPARRFRTMRAERRRQADARRQKPLETETVAQAALPDRARGPLGWFAKIPNRKGEQHNADMALAAAPARQPVLAETRQGQQIPWPRFAGCRGSFQARNRRRLIRGCMCILTQPKTSPFL